MKLTPAENCTYCLNPAAAFTDRKDSDGNQFLKMMGEINMADIVSLKREFDEGIEHNQGPRVKRLRTDNETILPVSSLDPPQQSIFEAYGFDTSTLEP